MKRKKKRPAERKNWNSVEEAQKKNANYYASPSASGNFNLRFHFFFVFFPL